MGHGSQSSEFRVQNFSSLVRLSAIGADSELPFVHRRRGHLVAVCLPPNRSAFSLSLLGCILRVLIDWHVFI